MKKSWIKVSLLFLSLVAVIGTWLRANFLFSVPLQYDHLVHAHSHTAFQGWIYTVMFLIITQQFLTEEQIQKGKYPLQFKLTIGVIFGVLISFSIQGYALFSIIFSTLFQFLNYWFIYRFFKDVKKRKEWVKNRVSLRFVKTGLWLALLSTFMPYGIGALSAKGLNGTEIYQSFIYAFLHFQYNGWFLFVALGILFKSFENDQVSYNENWATWFYRLFTVAVIPALSLSLLGMSFREWMILPAHFSGVLQIVGLFLFVQILRKSLYSWFQSKNVWLRLFFMVFLSSFLVKTILQYLSVFPVFEMYAFENKNIVLAYLHLSLLGVITFFLLAMLIDFKWLVTNSWTKVGGGLVLAGFVITELLLVLGGMQLGFYQGLLFVGSLAMAVGIITLFFSPQKVVG